MYARQLFIIVMICLVPLASVQRSQGPSMLNVLKVPEDFATVQEAIDNAASGDLILVAAGTYYEQLTIDKPLTLNSENKTTTIIDGNTSGVCMRITSDNVVVTGFTIRNALIGVVVQDSSGSRITENIVTQTLRESIVLNRTRTSIVANNTLIDNTEGIHLVLSTNNTISQNVVSNSVDFGIFLDNSTYNRVIGNSPTANHDTGIFLADSNHNTIQNNNITTSNDDGMVLQRSRNNSVTGNAAFDNHHSGFYLINSANNTLSGNILANNGWHGMQFYQSDDNRIINNTERANGNFGVYLFNSKNNLLRNNTMVENGYNFRVAGVSLQDFLNDVDASNRVDGKPIYYWIGKHGVRVPLDAGYVAVINSTEVQVSDLFLSNNGQGVLFAYTNNSVLARFEASLNLYGVQFFEAYDNRVILNTLANNTFGIFIQNSGNNTFCLNTVSNSMKGVVGSFAFGNSFFRNNFMNQSLQTDLYQWYGGAWDTGFEGNHWDTYAGIDVNGDGIGDQEYVLDTNNRDRYPLMHFYIPGDVNHDGTVNGTDANALVQAWMRGNGEELYNPFVDLDFDGIVNVKDATFVGLNWERKVP